MKRFLFAGLVAIVASASWAGAARADEAEAAVVIDKAIKALGGEAKLAKAGTFVRKAKGTITINGNDNEVTSETTTQALDHNRIEIEGKRNGQKFLQQEITDYKVLDNVDAAKFAEP